MRYTDFVLLARDPQIIKSAGEKRLTFTVLVPGVLDQEFQCELDVKTLRGLKEKATSSDAEWSDARALGVALSAALLPSPVWNALNNRITQAAAANEGIRVRMMLSGSELSNWPWEFMVFNRGGGESKVSDFLALMPNVSLVRHTATPLPAWRVEAKAPIKVLVAVASPSGWPALKVAEERSIIEKALADNQQLNVQGVEHTQRNQLPDKTHPAHIFHFAGHGKFEQVQSPIPGAYEGKASIVLEDGYGDEDSLDAGLLAVQLRDAGVRVAVLGACQTAQRDDVGDWSSVAEALLKAELGAVVGMQFPVRDKTGLAFSERFYSSLAIGLSIDEAVAAARVAIAVSEDPRGWATPVLYLRSPDGVIFPEFAADPTLEPARHEATVKVQQKIRILKGKATAAKIAHVEAGASAEIIQEIDTAEGEATALEAGTVGGSGDTRSQSGAARGRARARLSEMLSASTGRNEGGPGASTRVSGNSADVDAYIKERTENFTGRHWVFKNVNDWLADSNDNRRIFLLTGGPGTGKTAIAARLVQLSDGILTEESAPALGKGWLTYSQFCQAGSEGTLSPLMFVQSLSEALANRYPAFRIALEKLGSPQIVIYQPVTNANAGAHITGANVENLRIEIKGGDARPLFDLAVRIPLQALCDQQPTERIVILVDSLDEALTFNPDNNITQLLRLVSDFPAQARFILTSRSSSERVFSLVGRPTLDLIADAPPGLDEIQQYATSRLKGLPENKRKVLASRVAEKSAGNFLYAFHVLNDLISSNGDTKDPEALELPDALEGVYREFIKREMASNPSKWNDIYRPLLGPIAVARGDGLTRAQLIGITDLAEDTAQDVLNICSQYLVGGEIKTDPYRIYHQSFRDFLLTDEAYTIYPAERHAAIARYFEDKCDANWKRCGDQYALRYTAVHWADSAALSETKREMRTQALIKLTSNRKYQRAFESGVGDLQLLNEYLHRAVSVAALNDRDDMLPWLLKAAKEYGAFRRDYLRGEAFTTLAEEGKVEQAEKRLPLFADVGEDWQNAARLIIAWLAIEKNKSAAERLRDETVHQVAESEPLPLLRQRLSAALNSQSEFPVELGPAVSLEIGRELVKRVSGQEFDPELITSVDPSQVTRLGPQAELINEQKGYAANLDGPVLVNLARERGPEGTELVDQYISAHAGYNYVEYRNRSLWMVLHAVLRHHPGQEWVKQRLSHLLATALTGGGVDFSEMLPMTAAILSEQAGDRDPREMLDKWRTAALASADSLQNRRGADDPWGNQRRRLTSLMELYRLLIADSNEAEHLLNRIGQLPGGFAGYQAPAKLRLCDAVRACRIERPGLIDTTLRDALRSAHNIQDYHFCARITARCNSLVRWHQLELSGSNLADTLRRFVQSPADAEFAADHLIHEPYQFRGNNPDKLSIDEARRAETLEQLVEVFQRPALEFKRLNPEYGLTEKIPDRTLIRVPDPGFAPLLAVHFAARALADDSIQDDCAGLIRQLVPVAVSNPTALDSVLSYLLIAAQPEDGELMEELVAEAGPVEFADVAVPAVQIGPDAAIPA
jgi:hypothetical protein